MVSMWGCFDQSAVAVTTDRQTDSSTTAVAVTIVYITLLSSIVLVQWIVQEVPGSNFEDANTNPEDLCISEYYPQLGYCHLLPRPFILP